MNQILKGLYRLGRPEFPAFLVMGSRCVVQIDAGTTIMGPLYLQDIQELLGEGRGPDFLFHTHSHFDHVGSTPFLKRHFPEIKIGGSETFARRLSQPKAGKAIADLNRGLVQQNSMDRAFIPQDFDYSLLTVERILKNEDLVDLGGGASLEVLATPGHTNDSLSFFLPHLEAALPGDALGILPGDDVWVAPQFLSSYEDYLDSIDRVRKKAPKTLLLGHHSVVQPEEVGRFFKTAVADCRAFRDMIEQYLKEYQMKEEMVVQRIKEAEYYTLRQGKQPEAAFLLNLAAQVRMIAIGMKRDRAG